MVYEGEQEGERCIPVLSCLGIGGEEEGNGRRGLVVDKHLFGKAKWLWR